MNYLTNYYKNLSEQLQERINLLEGYLLEYKQKTRLDKKTGKRIPVKKVVPEGQAGMDVGNMSMEVSIPGGKGAQKNRMALLAITGKTFPDLDKSTEYDVVTDLQSPWRHSSNPINPIQAAAISGTPVYADSRELMLEPPIQGRIRNVPGTGKKKLKKEQAQNRAARERGERPSYNVSQARRAAIRDKDAAILQAIRDRYRRD